MIQWLFDAVDTIYTLLLALVVSLAVSTTNMAIGLAVLIGLLWIGHSLTRPIERRIGRHRWRDIKMIFAIVALALPFVATVVAIARAIFSR